MNKITTAALAGLVAVTATANASVSRWNGFGLAQAYIADVQDIWTLPGVVASHKNATYFELGADTAGFGDGDDNASAYQSEGGIPWGGVHAEVGPGVLGIWFNRPYGELSNLPGLTANPNQTPTGAAASNAFLTPLQTIDLLYGFALSDATTLGVAVNRATNSLKTETTTTVTTVTERASSDLGLGVGLEQKGVGPIDLLEVGLTFNMRSDTNTNNNSTVTNKNSQSGSDIDLRVGGDMTGDEGAFSRFEVGFNMDSLSTKTEPAAAAPANSYIEGKQSAMAWNLGYAMGKSSDKGMGLAGLMLSSVGTTRDEANNGTAVNKRDSSNLSLIATTAGEAKVKEWLSIRAGLSSALYYSGSVTTEAGAAGATTKTINSTDAVTTAVAAGGLGAAANAVASFGTSITLGSLVIDGVFNQDLFYTGPFLTNGIGEIFSSQVSATWAW